MKKVLLALIVIAILALCLDHETLAFNSSLDSPIKRVHQSADETPAFNSPLNSPINQVHRSADATPAFNSQCFDQQQDEINSTTLVWHSQKLTPIEFSRLRGMGWAVR